MLTREQFNKVQDQIKRAGRVPIYFEKQKYWMDHRRICLSENLPNKTPIVLQTGWGSDLHGIIPLAAELASRGYEVHLFSILGYGDSSNPPHSFYAVEDCLDNAASVLFQAMQYIGLEKVHLVGHSMGFQIVARVASEHPEIIESVIGMNPGGVRTYGSFLTKFDLAIRFMTSGAELRRKYANRQNEIQQELIDWCSRQKSPWGNGRWRQRLNEFLALSEDSDFHQVIREIKCPITFIFGSRDTVFRPSEVLRFSAVHGDNIEDVEGDLYHNSTLLFPFTERMADLMADNLR